MQEQIFNKPFGYSYLIDLYECDENKIDCMETVYRFLEELVVRLEMTPMAPPYLIHANSKFDDTFKRCEVYPDKEGISGFQPLIESGIAIHTIKTNKFITLDVYSCKEFNPYNIKGFIINTFGAKRHEEHFIKRGTEYNS